MSEKKQLTALIEREGDQYVSLCPELDVASQGSTIEEAKTNLVEAIELFFETASSRKFRGGSLAPCLRGKPAHSAETFAAPGSSERGMTRQICIPGFSYTISSAPPSPSLNFSMPLTG